MGTFQEGAAMLVTMVVRDMDATMKRRDISALLPSPAPGDKLRLDPMDTRGQAASQSERV